MTLVFNQEAISGEVEEKPEVTMAKVFNVPGFAEKYLDIPTRLRLRKTCKTIREVINEMPLHIDCFRYKCNGKFIEISTNKDFKVFYEITERELSVTNGDIEKVIDAKSEKEQIEIIQQDLMAVLCSEKLRIDTFEIEDDRTSGWEPPIGLRALRNTFSQVPNKLKITNLEYCVLDESEVLMETLKAIDPEHLESLQLNFQRYVYNCNPVWEDFYNLEQWKRLKTLNLQCPGLALSDIIKFFTHVENSNLEIHSFYGVNEISKHNEVMQIIEKLFQNPNLEQFIIEASYGLRSLDFADIDASLRQYDVNCAPWVDIPYPDSDKTLMMWVETNKIWFKGPCFVEEEDSSDEDEDEEEETEDEDEEDDRMRD